MYRATSYNQTQLTENVRRAVDTISPERDLVTLSSQFPKSLASAVPDRILYQHPNVGPCSDLLFGFSLLDYATTKNLHDGEVPKIIRLCINEIDRRGLESEGMYRVSGRLANVQMVCSLLSIPTTKLIVFASQLVREIEKDEANFEFKPQRDDVFVVGSLLKVNPVFCQTLSLYSTRTKDLPPRTPGTSVPLPSPGSVAGKPLPFKPHIIQVTKLHSA